MFRDPVLLEKDIVELKKTVKDVAESIRMFRNDEILMIPCRFREHGERIISENSQEREKSGGKSNEINFRYREK